MVKTIKELKQMYDEEERYQAELRQTHPEEYVTYMDIQKKLGMQEVTTDEARDMFS